jgi:acetyl-CoA acetyltransferase
MNPHPFRNVAIVGVYNTRQARTLDGENSRSIALKAALGAIDDAGLAPRDIDGVVGPHGLDFVYQARIGPSWLSLSPQGIPAVLEAANAIAHGMASAVLIDAGGAGVYEDRDSTAPWTRPTNEFVAAYGMYTAVEFALIARRHMHVYGTKPDAPFTPQDILESRMIADPFHLLDCAMTSEGGCALVLTRSDIAHDLAKPSVYVLGGNTDQYGHSYENPPSFDFGGTRRPDLVIGRAGRRAAEEAFRTAGLKPTDVDVCEFYDPFSFEIIRQFEAFGFCDEGEGGPFVMDGVMDLGGRLPTTTDGGLMSFSHGGGTVQLLQRVIRAVQQLRGECVSRQVPGAEVAMCSGGGAGAFFTDVMLLGTEQP